MTDKRYDRRPVLQIDIEGGADLGRCYASTTYVVRSNKPLKAADFQALRAAHFIGYGQEWRCSERPQEEMVYTPEGQDWRGQPYGEVRMPVHVYSVMDLVDSSD